ncbi:lipoprotein [Streptomyces sp. TS71-3]|nr:hypothetical protein [Streptomyces sp. TS71-3]GHJ35800.1 lipoprotein [Streptomyces sp. TS71-3]
MGAAVALAGVGLAGCGGDPDAGTNGEGKLSPQKIQNDTRKAAEAAKTVRLSGTLLSKGGTYKLDMRLTANGGMGSVTTKDGVLQLLRVGDHLYLKAGSSFWQGKGGKGDSASGVATKLSGKYVRVPKGDPAYQQLSGFTDKRVLLDGVLALHGKLGKGDHGTTDGIRTVAISGDGGDGGTLKVSLDGHPCPVRLERAGGAGSLKFTDWDKEFTVREPAKNDTVDYGKLPTS